MFHTLRRQNREEEASVYGLPENFDSAVFVGRTIDLVCVSVNQVIVHFDDDLHLVIQGDFSLVGVAGSVQGAGGDAVGSVSAANSRLALARLVGAMIARATGTRDGTLTIACDTGDVLQVFDSWPKYECYTITHRDEVVIV